MQAKLIVIGGKATHREVSLTLPIIIGRSRTAGLTIAHAMVSRKHCEIYEVGGLVRIRDLGSTNGTYVGGSRVAEAVLRPHDQFTVGPLTFEVDYPYAEDSTIVDQQTAGLAGASIPAAANAKPQPAPQDPAEAMPPSDAMPSAFGDGSSDPWSAEDFELAGQADGSSPAEAREPPAASPLAAEPPEEWAEPGPEIPPLPPDLASPEGPDLASAAIDPDSTLSADSPFHAPSDAPRFGNEGVGCESNGLSMDFLDSEPSPWEASDGNPQPPPLSPRAAPHKPKSKSRWWPFGKRK